MALELILVDKPRSRQKDAGAGTADAVAAQTAMLTEERGGFESRDDGSTVPCEQLDAAISALEAVDWRRTSISPAEAGAFVARLQEARERQEENDE